MTDFADRIIIITGGASGIGAAAAKLAAARGARIVVADLQTGLGTEVASAVDGRFMRHDVSDPNSWSELLAQVIAEIGSPCGLVSAAGIKSNGTVADAPDVEAFQKTVAVNQQGILLGLQTFGRYMCERKRGAIVNVASATGMPPAVSQDIGYVSTKWAVRGISRTAARQFAPHGVRVNTVLPGLVQTPMIAASFEANPDQVAHVEASIPMRRLAQPEEIAQAICFLLSDQASYAAGAELVIDGGLVA